MLESFGWTTTLAERFVSWTSGRGPGLELEPARVTFRALDRFRLTTAAGSRPGRPAGTLRDVSGNPHELPVVGDWVAIDRLAAAPDGEARIRLVLPRRSAFVRQSAGEACRAQVVAANVDVVLIVVGADADFNLRRVERYLALAWESGALPVVLLNKLDLHEDPAALLAELAAVAPGVDVVGVSAAAAQGLDRLTPYLQPGRTVALLGSSGVGKSTLVNRLLGEPRLRTGEVRLRDGRGCHVTTSRELFALPGGALVIDTPGMRELQLWGEGRGLDQAFDELAALAARCRFADCRHLAEPGCAVRAAVEQGRLDPARLASYRKLQAEQQHHEERSSEAGRREARRKGKQMGKMLREVERFNPKRR